MKRLTATLLATLAIALNIIAGCHAPDHSAGEMGDQADDDGGSTVDDDSSCLDDDDDNNDLTPTDDDSNDDDSGDDDDDDDATPDIEFFGIWGWVFGWPHEQHGCGIRHWRGAAIEEKQWSPCELFGIWGRGPEDVYAVGCRDMVPPGYGPALPAWTAFDGDEWRLRLALKPLTRFEGVSGAASFPMFVAAEHWTASPSWTIYHWNGVGWSISAEAGTEYTEYLNGIWTASTGETFAIGGYQGADQAGGWLAVQNDDGNWRIFRGEERRFELNAVWGASKGDVFAVGAAPGYLPAQPIVLHYDGSDWRDMGVAGLFSLNLYAVAGSSGGDVYAAGGDSQSTPVAMVLRYDGETWSDTGLPVEHIPHGVWVAGPKQVFVPLENDGVWRYDGEQWTKYSDVEVTYLWGFVHSPGERE